MHLKPIITVFLLCLYTLCAAQTKTLTGVVKDRVSGTVTDTKDQPLPGVTVLVKGTFRGTTTGADGRYSLTNVPAGAALSFSFVGFKTQEIPFEGQTPLLSVTTSAPSLVNKNAPVRA